MKIKNKLLFFFTLFSIINMTIICSSKTIVNSNIRNYSNTITTARETLWNAITTGKGSGASIAIMDNGKIIYSEGIGTKNRSSNSPVDVNTRFNIGSTSKMFAAVAVLLLVDKGKI